MDGDKSLVESDEPLIEVAKRVTKNTVPLYYDMKKAGAVQLNSDTMFAGLTAAYTSGNIGYYSNTVSKILNSEVWISGTEEEKQEAIFVIKILCMENNFCIDANCRLTQ